MLTSNHSENNSTLLIQFSAISGDAFFSDASYCESEHEGETKCDFLFTTSQLRTELWDGHHTNSILLLTAPSSILMK